MLLLRWYGAASAAWKHQACTRSWRSSSGGVCRWLPPGVCQPRAQSTPIFHRAGSTLPRHVSFHVAAPALTAREVPVAPLGPAAAAEAEPTQAPSQAPLGLTLHPNRWRSARFTPPTSPTASHPRSPPVSGWLVPHGSWLRWYVFHLQWGCMNSCAASPPTLPLVNGVRTAGAGLAWFS